MKTILIRTTRIIIALVLGSSLFILLSYAGGKSKGPLDDMAILLNKNLASLEKQMVDTRDSRSASLEWFNKYRNNKAMLLKPEIVLLGAYDDNTAESYESVIALEEAIHTHLPVMSVYCAWGSKRNHVFPV